MENLICVVVQHDWFDYLATLAPFALSVIAVIIAVSTARKQNKIALFEKRVEVIDYLFEFFKTWEALAQIIIIQQDVHGINLACQYAIVTRLRKTGLSFNIEQINANNMNEEIRKLELVDVMYLHRTTRLFKLTAIQKDVVTELGQKYNSLLDGIISIQNDPQGYDQLRIAAASFIILSTRESTELIKDLEKQTVIKG